MRAEVQEILDKDWPDDLDRKWPVYGARNKQRALIRLAMDAEDCGDDELYSQAYEAANNINDPTNRRDKLRVIFPQSHTFIHGKERKLLIFEEKHGSWYFTPEGPEEIAKALLMVLHNRVDEEWFLDELYGDDLPKEGVNLNQMDMFSHKEPPKTDMQKAKDILALARSGKSGTLIKAGKRALEFFQEHSDREYERFIVEYPTEIEFS